MIRVILTTAVWLLGAGCATSSDRSPATTASDEALSFHSPDVSCVAGLQPTGASYLVCLPDPWNGDLVVYGHGYRSPIEEPVPQIHDDAIGGVPVSQLALELGYGFGTTSYSDSGLVADVAVLDLEDVIDRFVADFGVTPAHRYLIGASEGGLSTALALEQASTGFDGGLVLCAPVGSFLGQIHHFGDARVVFDYFFPGVLPGDAVSVPLALAEDWEAVYVPAILAALQADPGATEQYLSVTGIAVDPRDPSTIGASVVDVLWYNAFATNDAIAKLGGNPYGNGATVYEGSDDDVALNLGVDRFVADPAAVAALASFETTGALEREAVQLHTVLDPVIPFEQALLYAQEVQAAGRSDALETLPSLRYGHCNFRLNEALLAFGVLVSEVEGPPGRP